MLAVPWGVVSEDGKLICDPELAESRAPTTSAKIVVLSPATVRETLEAGRMVDQRHLCHESKFSANNGGVLHHGQTLARGTCSLCEQYAILGWWCAKREDFVCCACHDRHDDDEADLVTANGGDGAGYHSESSLDSNFDHALPCVRQ